MGYADRMIVLASASPRRAQLLKAAGIRFDVRASDVDETPQAGEDAADYVARLALEKARTVSVLEPGRLVLGADTTVIVDGRMLGKPADAAEAEAMLRVLAGRAHEVLTGVALVGPHGEVGEVARTTVWFRFMTSEDIRGYVETGEASDKAGAYGIQGRAAAFVERISGSYTNVVGLPIALVCRLLLKYSEGRRS
jgi:septum formation protein